MAKTEEQLSVLDLCSGMGGFSDTFAAEGWRVVGVDITMFPEYKHSFIQADVRKFNSANAMGFDLIVASPPCQQFSYYSLPYKKAKQKAIECPPDESIWRACVKLAEDTKTPLVLENVRGAEKYMGEAKEKYGSFYFWYDVPPMPNVKATKGFTVKKGRGMAGEYERHPGFKEMAAKVGCKATRAYFAAQKAMIPKGAVKIISDYYKAKLIK